MVWVRDIVNYYERVTFMFIYGSHGDYKICEQWCRFLDVDLVVTS